MLNIPSTVTQPLKSISQLDGQAKANSHSLFSSESGRTEAKEGTDGSSSQIIQTADPNTQNSAQIRELTNQEIEPVADHISTCPELLPVSNSAEVEAEQGDNNCSGAEILPVSNSAEVEAEQGDNNCSGAELLPVSNSAQVEAEQGDNNCSGAELLPVSNSAHAEEEQADNYSSGADHLPVSNSAEVEEEQAGAEPLSVCNQADL